jgi:TfoX/Sxy family transcriptional regulator of competence genes
LEQLSPLSVSARKMFGEYALYYDGKVVALVCDDLLFVKPTESGKQQIEHLEEKTPYPGAKLYFLIDTDLWEQRDWLQQLIITTAAALPVPKPKKKILTEAKNIKKFIENI